MRRGHKKICRRKSAPRANVIHYKSNIILLDINWNHSTGINKYCELLLYAPRLRQRVSQWTEGASLTDFLLLTATETLPAASTLNKRVKHRNVLGWNKTLTIDLKGRQGLIMTKLILSTSYKALKISEARNR